MVGRFHLPSLPSLPTSLSDLLDTSPPVFYPPARPSSRNSISSRGHEPPSCPASPPRRPVQLTADDRRASMPPPSSFWVNAAHPGTDAPLASRERTLSHLPPRQSSLYSRGDVRPPHKRSQSAAPGGFNFAPSTAPPMRLEPRTLHPSSSAASLPTLAEDAAPDTVFPVMPVALADQFDGYSIPTRPTRSRRHSRVIEPSPTVECTGRRRAQSSVTMTSLPGAGTFAEPALAERLQRRHSQVVCLPSSAQVTKPPTPICPVVPMTPRERSRRGSVSSMFSEHGARASPTPGAASVSVSEVAAHATWSQEPISPTVTRSRSTRDSVASPSESLRARLRTLSKLEGRDVPSSPPPVPPGRNPLASPTTPRSTCGTPGHGTPVTPGSSTPTTSSHSHVLPLSPTPTRRRPIHRHTLSLPYAEDSRPTTSRLRQPAQLSMAAMTDALDMPPPPRPPRANRSRPASMLEPPSPMLASSPGSLISDNGSASPTTSIESLPLGPAWLSLNMNFASQQGRAGHSANTTKRSSVSSINDLHDRRQSIGGGSSGHGHGHGDKRASHYHDKRSSITSMSDKRASISSVASVSVSRRGSHTSAQYNYTWDWRRGGPAVQPLHAPTHAHAHSHAHTHANAHTFPAPPSSTASSSGYSRVAGGPVSAFDDDDDDDEDEEVEERFLEFDDI